VQIDIAFLYVQFLITPVLQLALAKKSLKLLTLF
jgi:hypothetical protein